MDFSLTPEEEAFKKEVNDWLDENMKDLPDWYIRNDGSGPEPESEESLAFNREWHKKLYAAGFVGIAWPKEYGGRGATLMEQVIFNEEMAKRRAPMGAGGLGVGWAGPTIIAAGTEEQKKRFLPKILSGEEQWCQGFSEPGAGSDLKNIQTRAVEDGDYYVVNGQKVWTTGGMRADWAILLARTNFDPDIPKQRGISYFLLDMHAPGVTVRPLREMTGYALFGETFLDDVRIHKSLMVGEKDRGFYISMGTLEFERSNASSAVGLLSSINELIALARNMQRNADPVTRQKIAQFYIEANVAKYIGLRALTRQLRGMTPGPESAVGSALTQEMAQRLQDYAMYLQGPFSRLVRDSKHAIKNGSWQRSFLNSRGNTIATGTSEVKRNIIAQRTLGLPRWA
ncbi:MAG: acyl-CoA dehydrogenase family protein [Dehalococcoidales bacterium]|nr:acyl-CoA dehydrogenase family protein [Dehalococcoidales bacterium]